jgi:cobalamin biosynthesis Mg chelatase CobN
MSIPSEIINMIVVAHIVLAIGFYIAGWFSTRHNSLLAYIFLGPIMWFVMWVYALRFVLFVVSLPLMLGMALIRRFVLWSFMWANDDITGWFWAIYRLEYNSALSASIQAEKDKFTESMKKTGETVKETKTQLKTATQLVAEYEYTIEHLETIIERANKAGLTVSEYMKRTHQVYQPLSAQTKGQGKQQGKQGKGQQNTPETQTEIEAEAPETEGESQGYQSYTPRNNGNRQNRGNQFPVTVVAQSQLSPLGKMSFRK